MPCSWVPDSARENPKRTLLWTPIPMLGAREGDRGRQRKRDPHSLRRRPCTSACMHPAGPFPRDRPLKPAGSVPTGGSVLAEAGMASPMHAHQDTRGLGCPAVASTRLPRHTRVGKAYAPVSCDTPAVTLMTRLEQKPKRRG